MSDVLLNSILPPSEFSEKFVTYMKNRMLVSFHKYGKVADAYPSKLNAVESLKLRLEKYAETHNTEYLVDVANFAMIEFMFPSHSDAFFEGTDSYGSPGRVSNIGKITRKSNENIVL